MEVIEENKMIDAEIIKSKFWEMFIVDSLIGNTDRHNGNWGFLLNKKTGNISFSPIYDCGSCLNPMLEDEEIEKINQTELKNLAINCYSCLKEDNKKINYMTYLKDMKNEECNNAIRRIFANININEIKKFINNIECMSEIRKNFYNSIIEQRYNIIKNIYEIIK
jgi:predicted transposase YbfD/YdcC